MALLTSSDHSKISICSFLSGHCWSVDALFKSLKSELSIDVWLISVLHSWKARESIEFDLKFDIYDSQYQMLSYAIRISEHFEFLKLMQIKVGLILAGMVLHFLPVATPGISSTL